MASYTPNYNLYKPAGTDQFDNFLTEFGNNMDVIDQNLGGGGGSSTLAGLSDVNLTSPVTNDALIYDGAEWVDRPLSAVAFSGDYTDLLNAPTIPTNTSDLNNDSGFLDSSDITVTQVQTTGTKIATIDVDGNSTDLYAPTGGGGSYTEGDGIDITNNAISVDTTFTEASTRANINSGDSFSTILGKIKKWFTDIPSLFVDKSGDTMSGRLTITDTAEVQFRAMRNHTNTTSQPSGIMIGNNIPNGTAGSDYGRLIIYGKGNEYTRIESSNTSSRRVQTLPDADGTIALTSDIPEMVMGTVSLSRAAGNQSMIANISHPTLNPTNAYVLVSVSNSSNIDAPFNLKTYPFGSSYWTVDATRYSGTFASNATIEVTYQLIAP